MAVAVGRPRGRRGYHVLDPRPCHRRGHRGWGGWQVLAAELGLILLVALAYLAGLRRREARDEQDPPVTDYDHVAQLASKEDRIVQNQMSSDSRRTRGMARS